MKKITLLLITMLSAVSFGQSKTTGTISLNNGVPITANFTLNNTTSQVTLILTGPADRWFGLGFGTQVVAGFGMNGTENGGQADLLVFTTTTTPNLTDRWFNGTGTPPQDTQNWTTVSNTISGTTRTLTLTRALTTADTNDFQMPYASTNTIRIGGVRGSTANNFTVSSHGGAASAGYATLTLTTLGVEDFSLRASQVYPNPSNGEFLVKTKTTLEKINIYTQTGAFVKTIEVKDTAEDVEVNITGLQTGVYLIELVNENEKSWKKVIVK
jgi:hypothetical protein